MAAHFEFEHEVRRIQRARCAGASEQDLIQSTAVQLQAVIAERTRTLSPFNLEATNGRTKAEGFDYKDDLGEAYQQSVTEAPSQTVAKRYQLEIDGYTKAQKEFFNLPKYTTHALMSPAPDVPMKGYEKEKNMMYFYHVLPGENEDKRTIKALTWENKFSREEQAEIINRLMGKEVAEPTTESILMTPLSVCTFSQDTKSFKAIWDVVGEIYKRKERDFPYYEYSVMEEFLLHGKERFQKNYHELSAMAENLASRIVLGATESQLKKDYRILMNLADKQLLHKDTSPSIKEPERYVHKLPQGAMIFDHYRHLERYAVRQVATACGPSGELGGSSSTITTQTYEVTRGAPTTMEISEWYTCPKTTCGYKATGPIGDTCPGCGLTKEEYAEEGGEVCA